MVESRVVAGAVRSASGAPAVCGARVARVTLAARVAFVARAAFVARVARVALGARVAFVARVEFAALVAFTALVGCDAQTGGQQAAQSGADATAAAEAPADGRLEPAQQEFWDNLRQHCGNAYAGRLTLEPPGDDMLTGTEELVVHFRECGADTLRLPFHIEQEATSSWDRSRTWLFMRGDSALELRHDHRHEDGSPDDVTMYGAHTLADGSANVQEFILTERRAADGSALGWRIEIQPHERYTYGTIRGGEWTWRVDFDLTRSVPAPPAPWGH
jgi:hypothetical protein